MPTRVRHSTTVGGWTVDAGWWWRCEVCGHLFRDEPTAVRHERTYHGGGDAA